VCDCVSHVCMHVWFHQDGLVDCVVGGDYGTIYTYINVGSVNSPVFDRRTGNDNPFFGMEFGDRSTPTFADITGDMLVVSVRE
jgi:hypothetical protein